MKFYEPIEHDLKQSGSLTRIVTTLRLISFLFLTTGFISNSLAGSGRKQESKNKWVGTWSTAPQLVETGNNPPSPGLSNNTIRQIVHVSIGGDSLRMRFTNEFSTNPVKMNSVHIAVSSGGSKIDTATDKEILFSGKPDVTMDPGSAVISDAFDFPLQPLSNVAITIFFGETSPDISGHPGSRTTSYILQGNEVTREDFSGAVTTDHWYIINTIDVMAPDSSFAIAVLGNSITDGRGSGTNKQNRWPDELSLLLRAHEQTRNVAVLNEGIGGNCVLGTCLGPSALSRYSRDVLEQNGVKWVIILEGINDVGNAWGSGVGNKLIDAYKQMIQSAHAKGLFVYGATLMPMKGHSYYSTSHEAERQIVNNWIRYGGMFDAVIDMDKALRNPNDTLSLNPAADTGDHLHPNETGHRMMAEAVDLNLFTDGDSVSYNDESKYYYYEAECGDVGANWEILPDNLASNRKYVRVKAGIQSLESPPAESIGRITLSISVDTTGTFSVYGRLDCPTADDDSFWIKMDSGDFQLMNNLTTSGWEWKKFGDHLLTKGGHILTIGYREDGAKLDKICVTNAVYAPTGMGDQAINLCAPTEIEKPGEVQEGYGLEQNFPNPFNPVTSINFSVPRYSHVSLKVFDVLGNEVANLVDDMRFPGSYMISFSGTGLASGIYLCQMKSDSFTEIKKIVLLK